MFAVFFDKFDRRSVLAAGLALALAAGVFAGSARAQTAPAAPARILLLATGGTIAGQASARAGNAYDSGKVSGANLAAAVPGLDKVAQITAEQICQMMALACEQPQDRPISRWKGREIAEEVMARGIMKQISPRHAARF